MAETATAPPTRGLVEGYEHPLRNWMLQHNVSMRELCDGAQVPHQTVLRILQGRTCSWPVGYRVIEWSWEGRVASGLRMSDLLPRPEVERLDYPERSHWYEW